MEFYSCIELWFLVFPGEELQGADPGMWMELEWNLSNHGCCEGKLECTDAGMENAARGMGGSSLGSSSDDPWGSACFPGPAVLDELHVQQVSLQQQLPGQGRAGCKAPAHSSWTPWSLWSLPAQETQDSVLSVNSVLSVAAGLGCWTPGGLFRGFSSHSQIQKCQKSHLMSSCAIPWCVGVQSLLCHPRLQGQPLLQQGWLAEGDGGVSADPKCFTAELYHSLP